MSADGLFKEALSLDSGLLSRIFEKRSNWGLLSSALLKNPLLLYLTFSSILNTEKSFEYLPMRFFESLVISSWCE